MDERGAGHGDGERGGQRTSVGSSPENAARRPVDGHDAFAAWLGLRAGRIIPFVGGFLCSAMGQSIWIAAAEPWMLWMGGMLWGFGFYFVSPYQMGLAAAIDRRGRVAVLAGGLLNLGYGIGPTLGGRIRQYQLDQGLDRTILIVAIAVLLLFLIPVIDTVALGFIIAFLMYLPIRALTRRVRISHSLAVILLYLLLVVVIVVIGITAYSVFSQQ